MRNETQELVKQYQISTTAIADYCDLPAPRVSDYLKDRNISAEMATKIESAVRDLAEILEIISFADVRKTNDMKRLHKLFSNGGRAAIIAAAQPLIQLQESA
jgi:predicted transcriptional regulator